MRESQLCVRYLRTIFGALSTLALKQDSHDLWRAVDSVRAELVRLEAELVLARLGVPALR